MFQLNLIKKIKKDYKNIVKDIKIFLKEKYKKQQ